MKKYLSPLLAGAAGGAVFLLLAALASAVFPSVEYDLIEVRIGALLFVLIGVAEAIARAVKK